MPAGLVNELDRYKVYKMSSKNSLRFFVSLIQREDFWYIFFFVKNLKNWNGG